MSYKQFQARTYINSAGMRPSIHQKQWMERYNSKKFVPVMDLLPTPMVRGDHWRDHYKILLDCLSAHATRNPGQASINQAIGVDGFPVMMETNESWTPLKSAVYCKPAKVDGPEAYHHAYPDNNDWAAEEKTQHYNATLWCLLEYFVEDTELWTLVEHLKPSQHGREAFALIMAHCFAIQIIANFAAFQEKMEGSSWKDVFDPEYARYSQYRGLCLSANGWGPSMYGSPFGKNVWGESQWTPPYTDAPITEWMRSHLIRERNQYEIRNNRHCSYLHEREAVIEEEATQAARARSSARRLAQVQEDFQIARQLQSAERARVRAQINELNSEGADHGREWNQDDKKVSVATAIITSDVHVAAKQAETLPVCQDATLPYAIAPGQHTFNSRQWRDHQDQSHGRSQGDGNLARKPTVVAKTSKQLFARKAVVTKFNFKTAQAPSAVPRRVPSDLTGERIKIGYLLRHVDHEDWAICDRRQRDWIQNTRTGPRGNSLVSYGTKVWDLPGFPSPLNPSQSYHAVHSVTGSSFSEASYRKSQFDPLYARYTNVESDDEANGVKDNESNPVPIPPIVQVKIEEKDSSDDETSLYDARKPAAKPSKEPWDDYEDEQSSRTPDC